MIQEIGMVIVGGIVMTIRGAMMVGGIVTTIRGAMIVGESVMTIRGVVMVERIVMTIGRAVMVGGIVMTIGVGVHLGGTITKVEIVTSMMGIDGEGVTMIMIEGTVQEAVIRSKTSSGNCEMEFTCRSRVYVLIQ
jgi:hypothetical protein